jgi:hypothetical protein
MGGFLPGDVAVSGLRANLRMPSLGLLIFLVGLNGMYFLPLIFPQALFEEAIGGTFRYYFLSWILVTIGGVIESRASGWWLGRHKKLWSWVTIGAIALTATTSVLGKEPLYSIIYKSLPFYWLIFIPAIAIRAKNWPWLWLFFLIHGLVGALYSLRTFLVEGATMRFDIIKAEGQNFLSICLYMAAFLFMLTPAIRGRTFRITAISLFMVELAKAFFFQNRLTWLLLPAQIVLIGYILLRSMSPRSFVTKFTMGLITIMVLLVITNAVIRSIPRTSDAASSVERAYMGLISRMQEKGSIINTIRENERWIELHFVVESMKTSDWLIGKGLSARWSSPAFAGGEERYMVHNTWLNCFYWGGLLMFLSLFIPFLWVVRLLALSRNVVALCCGSYLFTIFVAFPSFLRTMATLDWLVFCLMIGVIVWHEQSPFIRSMNRQTPAQAGRHNQES